MGCGQAVEHAHFLFQASLKTVLFDLKIVAGLQVQPVTLRQTEVARKAQGGVGADSALAVDDLIDAAGWTPMSCASRYWLMPNGFRNSSRSILPGCTGANLAFVVLASVMLQ